MAVSVVIAHFIPMLKDAGIASAKAGNVQLLLACLLFWDALVRAF
ncbi:MAG: hypothetical protein ACJAVO_002758 [Parvibaculaceae bacterium]|jgi:hypothetical protein|tara:strand:- start:349 stop:483 length:135 start_codon:yes stop_codon:yes gene_type:complete